MQARRRPRDGEAMKISPRHRGQNHLLGPAAILSVIVGFYGSPLQLLDPSLQRVTLQSCSYTTRNTVTLTTCYGAVHKHAASYGAVSYCVSQITVGLLVGWLVLQIEGENLHQQKGDNSLESRVMVRDVF